MSSAASSYDNSFPDHIRKPLRNMYRITYGKLVLDRLLTFDESARVVKVEELEDISMLKRIDIIQQFRLLRDMGLGTFTTGRRGHSSRFEAFRHSLKQIGEFAIRLSRPQDVAQDKNYFVDSISPENQKFEEEIGEFDIRLSRPQDVAQDKNYFVDSISLENQKFEEETEPRGEIQSLGHRFLLRPDYPVIMRLPKDLSDSEACRLSDFVKSLPFH